MEKIKIAAVATENWVGEQKRSLENMEAWVQSAVDQDSELILFPELNISGYIHHRIAWQNSEPVPGPSTEKMVELASKYNTLICAGVLENSSDLVFNTQVLVGPQGFIGKQRKIHMPADEYPYWRGGSDLRVFDIGKAKVGIAICYDSLFSELTRSLFFLGAEILLMPFAYWTPIHRSVFPEQDITGINYRSTCYDNGFFGVVCNNAGERPESELEPEGRKFPGWAGVFSPSGEVLGFTRDEGIGEAMSVVELDPDLIEDRRSNPWFQPRCLRPNVYLDINEQMRK